MKLSSTTTSQSRIDDLLVADGEMPARVSPKDVSPAAAQSDNWVTTFAMLTLSGCGLEMAAERLGKPKQVLESLFNTPNFQSLIKSIATETGKDPAVSLLRSSAVDSVLAIIKLRDSAQSENVRLKAASSLLSWNYFHRNSADLPSNVSAIHDALRKSGMDVSDALDRELVRLVEANPVLKANPLLASLRLDDPTARGTTDLPTPRSGAIAMKDPSAKGVASLVRLGAPPKDPADLRSETHANLQS